MYASTMLAAMCLKLGRSVDFPRLLVIFDNAIAKANRNDAY